MWCPRRWLIARQGDSIAVVKTFAVTFEVAYCSVRVSGSSQGAVANCSVLWELSPLAVQ
jgi:hypothetical protein